jgi:hypothetical protein
MAGNDIVGGAIGAGMDVPTGAMLELTPNPLIATMQPAIRTVAASKGSNGCCLPEGRGAGWCPAWPLHDLPGPWRPLRGVRD